MYTVGIQKNRFMKASSPAFKKFVNQIESESGERGIMSLFSERRLQLKLYKYSGIGASISLLMGPRRRYSSSFLYSEGGGSIVGGIKSLQRTDFKQVQTIFSVESGQFSLTTAFYKSFYKYTTRSKYIYQKKFEGEGCTEMQRLKV